MNAWPSRRSRSFDRLVATGTETLRNPRGGAIRRHAILLQRIPVSNRHRAVLRGLTVDRDAIRCSDLVLSAIPPADGTRFVVEHGEALSQLGCQLRRKLRHAVLLHERKD